jgi:UDP-GlcNAc:undecaprenyl-phosphate/decaprenyl-phosphate GlcNAc-1-phosphate transferase
LPPLSRRKMSTRFLPYNRLLNLFHIAVFLLLRQEMSYMYSLIFLFFSSCSLSLILTPFVRNAALRFGVVDRPDNCRKVHKTPIPRLGGVAILAAVICAYGLLLLVRLSAGHIVRSGMPFALHLFPVVALIFGVGLWDDIFGLNAWKKLAVHVLAALLAWVDGIRLDEIGSHTLPVALSVALTVAWIIACTNAVNLIDGVDGLATGVGLFATITILIASLLHHNIDLAFAIVPLAGALLGFLRFNFNPASIFLGDSGSLTVGFLLGCYGIVWSEKSTTVLSMSAPLLALSLPLLDVALAISRRFMRQQPIFSADRGHIHHRLLSRGLTTRRVVFILYGFSGLAAIGSLLLTTAREQYHGFVILFLCLVAWLGLQYLGYNDFAVAGNLIFRGDFLNLLSARLRLIGFEKELSACAILDECCLLICQDYAQFGFSGILFRLDSVEHKSGLFNGWQVLIDFPGHGYVYLTHEPGAKGQGTHAVHFVDCISRVLSIKLDELDTKNSVMQVESSAAFVPVMSE